jgi:hypothetical protein
LGVIQAQTPFICDKWGNVAEEKTQPVCFIVSSLGDENAPAHCAADNLLREIVRPVLGQMGFSIMTAHELSDPGLITNQIIERLLNDQLVIADLTGLSPNVMYEVGVRHCARLPLVVLAEKGTKLPFEIQDEGILFYESDIASSEALRPRLKQMCEKAIADTLPGNPVYNAVKSSVIKRVAEKNNAPQHDIEKADLADSRPQGVSFSQNQQMSRSPRTSPDQVFVDWIMAEGDGAAIRNLIDEIGGMGYILAARFFDVGDGKTRIEFRHSKKMPSTYIIMKHLTMAGFKVTDASVKSETVNLESSAE